MTPDMQRVASRQAKPLSEHDLEHRNIRLQLFLLRQLVLRLYTEQYFDAAPAVVAERLAQVRDAESDPARRPAERAMLADETAEVFAELEEHVELIAAGAL